MRRSCHSLREEPEFESETTRPWLVGMRGASGYCPAYSLIPVADLREWNREWCMLDCPSRIRRLR